MSKFSAEPGILYLVATPIGNLGDITFRAIEILKSVDLIASEDSRNSKKLLDHYNINTKQTSYHDHNEKTKALRLLEMLKSGLSIALITDAGMPLISDPGYRVVNLAIQNNIDISVIPGPSSVLTALVLSGFPMDRFSFEGYPPKSPGKLRRFFEQLNESDRTIVYFETPHKIAKNLKLFFEIAGDREIMIGRELTKKFEEKIRGTLSEMTKALDGKGLKGEMVVVVKAAGKR